MPCCIIVMQNLLITVAVMVGFGSCSVEGDDAPTEHGCYLKQPVGCNGGRTLTVWTRDAYGEANLGSATSKTSCEVDRKNGHDAWCGNLSSEWLFVPIPEGGVSKCTQIRNSYMIKSGFECETWNRLDQNCNLKSGWRQNKFCQQACFDIGLGYDGDDCSNSSPSPSPSQSTADVSTIVELIEAQVAKLELSIESMSDEVGQFNELLGTLDVDELCDTQR